MPGRQRLSSRTLGCKVIFFFREIANILETEGCSKFFIKRKWSGAEKYQDPAPHVGLLAAILLCEARLLSYRDPRVPNGVFFIFRTKFLPTSDPYFSEMVGPSKNSSGPILCRGETKIVLKDQLDIRHGAGAIRVKETKMMVYFGSAVTATSFWPPRSKNFGTKYRLRRSPVSHASFETPRGSLGQKPLD